MYQVYFGDIINEALYHPECPPGDGLLLKQKVLGIKQKRFLQIKHLIFLSKYISLNHMQMPHIGFG